MKINTILCIILGLSLFACNPTKEVKPEIQAEAVKSAETAKTAEPKATPSSVAKKPTVKETATEPKPAKMPEAAKTEAKTHETKKAPDAATTAPSSKQRGLLDPAIAKMKAPDKFKVKFETTKGDFEVEVTRAWAPNGADRFFSLVSIGFYSDIAIFRVIEGFMMQFGIHGSPAINKIWKDASIIDDTASQSNTPGMITFATRGKDTRTTQLFINYGNNARLDGMGFTPFGKVVKGMDVVKGIYSGYGEGAPRGMGPSQGRMQQEGNVYLKKEFEKLDYIKSTTIVK